MNRLYQLKETILQNITDNIAYDNLEFLILNYNSKDDMHDWVKKNLSAYISSGKVSYYMTKSPNIFNHSHSKNVAFKLAKGEIVCSINADHYTGKNFANYVNESFSKNENIFLTTIDYFKTRKDYYVPKDVFGKVCVRKKDFLNVSGFDEQMTGYGFEDWDFVNRLEINGLKRKLITNTEYLKFISHSDSERYSSGRYDYYEVYLNFIDSCTTGIIVFYDDKKFKKGTLIDNSSINSEDYRYAYLQRQNRFANSLKEGKWLHGTISNFSDDYFNILDDKGEDSVYNFYENKSKLLNSKDGAIYYKIYEPETKQLIMEFDQAYTNRIRMEENLKERDVNANKGFFGKEEIFPNFCSQPFSIL